MNIYRYILLLAIIISITACSKKRTSKIEKEPEPTVYEKIAKEMCLCTKDLIDLNDQLNDVAVSGDTEKKEKLLAQIDSIANDAEKCAEALEKKYEDIDLDDEANKSLLTEAIKKHCSNLAKLIQLI